MKTKEKKRRVGTIILGWNKNKLKQKARGALATPSVQAQATPLRHNQSSQELIIYHNMHLKMM